MREKTRPVIAAEKMPEAYVTQLQTSITQLHKDKKEHTFISMHIF
jgi:hypothetical protein